MNLQLNQKFEYLNIIQYGIDTIGKEIKIDNIEETFKGRTKIVDDSDNMEIQATNHMYLEQEHLCLSFEQGSFYGFIDFDLMPNNNSLKPKEQIKRLVNFKTQIFTKNESHELLPLNAVTYLTLKKQYGLSNNFDKFDKEKKKEFVKMDKLLREQYILLGVNADEIQTWYIEKQGIYYLATFYYFKGKVECPPYLSFAITEMFKFDK